MKVTVSEENLLEFDNGLKITGDHQQDCCEDNYLDFEQLPVGTEFPDYTATTFLENISIKDDGFLIKDIDGLPKWVQARSNQNGYYSDGVDMIIEDGSLKLKPERPGQTYAEYFCGIEKPRY